MSCDRRGRHRDGRVRPQCGKAAWDAPPIAPTTDFRRIRGQPRSPVAVCLTKTAEGRRGSAPLLPGSSPVITHERVIGSLRSSMLWKSTEHEQGEHRCGRSQLESPHSREVRAHEHRTQRPLCYNPPKPAPMTEPSTPLMRQYAAVKKEHPTRTSVLPPGRFLRTFLRRRGSRRANCRSR